MCLIIGTSTLYAREFEKAGCDLGTITHTLRMPKPALHLPTS